MAGRNRARSQRDKPIRLKPIRSAAHAPPGGGTAATYAKQEEAAQQQVALNQAQAKAERQTELTQSAIAVEIAANRGQASSRRLNSWPRNRSHSPKGSGAKELIGKGESSRIAQVGLAEAAVTLQKVGAYRDPRLYALNVFADQFSKSVQPLVPKPPLH